MRFAGNVPEYNRFGLEWNVNARNTMGIWSAWSETRVFDLDSGNPDCTPCDVVFQDLVENGGVKK